MSDYDLTVGKRFSTLNGYTNESDDGTLSLLLGKNIAHDRIYHVQYYMDTNAPSVYYFNTNTFNINNTSYITNNYDYSSDVQYTITYHTNNRISYSITNSIGNISATPMHYERNILEVYDDNDDSDTMIDCNIIGKCDICGAYESIRLMRYRNGKSYCPSCIDYMDYTNTDTLDLLCGTDDDDAYDDYNLMDTWDTDDETILQISTNNRDELKDRVCFLNDIRSYFGISRAGKIDWDRINEEIEVRLIELGLEKDIDDFIF